MFLKASTITMLLFFYLTFEPYRHNRFLTAHEQLLVSCYKYLLQ